MKQKTHVLIISCLAVVILVVSFIFAINYRKESINYFYDSGYIISNLYEAGSNNVNKLYFENETGYKKIDDNTYSFSNSEGEKVNVSKESFVHYSSGSIMSLKKGVALDLNNIDSKLISYYDIFEGSVLTKKNEVYEIENLGETITFSKLLFKISNNKYLLSSPKIVVSFSDEQIVDLKGYAEIEYVNENVIRIYNDEVNYQTIASNLYLIVDNVKIDLEYKTISKNNVEYLTMADMVINSDDNIEILPEKPEIVIPNENTGSNNNGSSNNNQGNNNGGQLDPDLQEGLDNLITNMPDSSQSEEKEEVVQPIFNVDSMDVTTLGFENLSLSFEDESSILYENRIVEILENSTGKVVATLDEWEEGNSRYVINSYLNLKPNTAYTLNVTGHYKIEDTVYDRTFISKIFRTLDLGLSVMDDYKTSNSLSFIVYKNSYSEVNGFKYNITDKNGFIIVEDTEVDFNGMENVIISPTQYFLSNTEYVLTIKDIKYGKDTYLTDSFKNLKLTHKSKTLKTNPCKSVETELKGVVDSSKNTVSFMIDGINDINGGIVSYTYNIYDNNSIFGEEDDTNKKSLAVVTKNDSTPLKLSFEDLGVDVETDSNVYFNVTINFDDNEKTLVYTSGNSQPIALSGTPYPTVVEYVKPSKNDNPDDGNVLVDDSDSLNGTIHIDDAYNYMKINNISNYKIVIKENINSTSGNTEQIVGIIEQESLNEGTSEYFLPISVGDLRPDTEYVLYVYLFKEDGFNQGKYVYLGYCTAKTEKAPPVYFNVEYSEDLGNKIIIFDFKLSKSKEKTSSSFEKLSYLTFKLYRGNNSKWEEIDFTATIPKSKESSEMYNLIKNNESVSMDANDFKFFYTDYERVYDYKVVVTGSAINNRYDIPVEIQSNYSDDNELKSNEFALKFNNIAPEVSFTSQNLSKSQMEYQNASQTPKKFKNSSVSQTNDELETNTIVGTKFTIRRPQSPSGDVVDDVSYAIYESNGSNIQGDCQITGDKILEGTITQDQTELIIPYSPYSSTQNANELYRGQHYCIEYVGSYKTSSDPNNTIELTPKYLHFFAEKQHVQITGYIKSYENENLVFDFNIKDPDKALLENDIELFSPAVYFGKGKYDETTNELSYSGVKSGDYALTIYEKIDNDADAKPYQIYNPRLDAKFELANVKVVLDNSQSGKIKLEIPFEICPTDLNAGQSNCEYNLKDSQMDKIAGLGITKDDGTFDALKLEKVDSGLQTIINLDDIESKGYGKILLNGTGKYELTLNAVSLLYDSGEIVDYQKTNSVFVKSINSDINNYFDFEILEFNQISTSSIFYPESLFSIEGYLNNYYVNEDLYFTLNKLNPDGTIGITLKNKKTQNRVIHFNKIEKYLAKLYNTSFEEQNTFEVKKVLTTSEISTKYTPKGAKVSFELTSSVSNGDKLEIELLESKTTVYSASIEYKCSDSCSWISHSSDNDKIVSISSTDNKKITVEFNNINDSDKYSYSIKYGFQINGSYEYLYTYNNKEKKNNENISIESLKALYLDESYEVGIKKNVWKKENITASDLDVDIKKLEWSFDVTETKYENPNEKITYKICAQKIGEGNQICIYEGNVDFETENKESVNLYNNNTLPAGTYKIILKSTLEYEDNDETKIQSLRDIILVDDLSVTNVEPNFSVYTKPANTPKFDFTIKDDDRMLTKCSAPDSGMIIGYLDQDSEDYYNSGTGDKRVVYFELWQNEEFIGYSPIPLYKTTSNLDLTTYFKNNLSGGKYDVKVSYCVKEERKTVLVNTLNIQDISDLNVSFVAMDSSEYSYFLLVFSDPNTTNLNKITKIEYNYLVDGVPTYKTIDDVSKRLTAQINGKTTYYLTLPLDASVLNTGQVSNLEVKLWSGATEMGTMYYSRK